MTPKPIDTWEGPAAPVPFSQDEIQRWGVVSVSNTVRVANACTSGCNWAGCPKRYIYNRIAFGDNKADRNRFSGLMNKVARLTVKHTAAFYAAVGEALRSDPNLPDPPR